MIDCDHIWDRKLAPTFNHAFVIAGANEFVASSGDRTAFSPIVRSKEEADEVADMFSAIFEGVSDEHRCVASQAAMGVRL